MCNDGPDRSRQHVKSCLWTVSPHYTYIGNSHAQCWPRQTKTILCIIFFVKSCFWIVGQHWLGSCLVQCWPRQIKTTWDRLFSYKKMSVCSQPTCISSSPYNVVSDKFGQHTVFLWNVIPVVCCIAKLSLQS